MREQRACQVIGCCQGVEYILAAGCVSKEGYVVTMLGVVMGKYISRKQSTDREEGISQVDCH